MMRPIVAVEMFHVNEQFSIGMHFCSHHCNLMYMFLFFPSSLCSIIYKKFIKANRPPEPPPDPMSMPLPPKPILQFYMMGYGVPLIIVGITAAVNMNVYAGITYCFLEWEPSLGAFYAPVALLVVWNLLLFLRISCVVRSGMLSPSLLLGLSLS